MRVKKHPIIDIKERGEIRFSFNGDEVIGYEGDMIASALHALGFKVLSRSILKDRARGFYCAIGNCGSCHMIVNGVSNVKTCITKLEQGMEILTQKGLGKVI